MGVGSTPTPPMARTLRRTLERPIWCTAAYPPPGRGETVLQRPLQVPWGRISCLVPCSPVLLPHCGCWALIDPASGSCSLSRPQRTWVLLSDALQRVLRQAGPHRHRRWPAHSAVPPSAHGRFIRCTAACSLPVWGRPPYNDLYISPGGALRTSILVPQRYFLDVAAGPALTPPADSALRRALSAVAYFLPGRGGIALQRPLQVPWESAPRLVPHSPMLLPRYGCRARTVTAGRPRPQHTRALYPMYCSVFSAKSGRVRPSMCSAGKRRSRWRDCVTTRVPGLGHGLKPGGPGSSGGPHAPGSDSPLFLWSPGASGYQLYKSMVTESGLFSRINSRPLQSHVLKRAPSWLLGHAPPKKDMIHDKFKRQLQRRPDNVTKKDTKKIVRIITDGAEDTTCQIAADDIYEYYKETIEKQTGNRKVHPSCLNS
ncbi:hypothetical protein NDU88_001687 [Pleurodeles waltl]|uniref:Uncharacterized protein n=1 Tax=Pleurodeles waltl TaxID=8319 RepID=A0AAV7VAF4_PLEWA|nr:hypothetical protein NDU88_001687 [Pleurodeles waltl]